MKFKIQIQENQLVRMSAAARNKMLRHEFAKIGRWWHRVARPRHFNRGAFQRYGYTRRKGNYNRRKKRKHGHLKPLVFSGQTFKASEQHRIIATTKGVSVIYAGTRKLNFRPKGSKINMRKEFESVNDRELKHMNMLVTKSIERKLQTAARTNGRIRLRS